VQAVDPVVELAGRFPADALEVAAVELVPSLLIRHLGIRPVSWCLPLPLEEEGVHCAALDHLAEVGVAVGVRGLKDAAEPTEVLSEELEEVAEANSLAVAVASLGHQGA